MNRLKKLVKSEKGQGMIEYTLILLVVVGIVLTLKDKMSTWTEGAGAKVQDGLDNF